MQAADIEQGDQDLGEYRICQCTLECFDFEVLLDPPFEELFDLPLQSLRVAAISAAFG